MNDNEIDSTEKQVAEYIHSIETQALKRCDTTKEVLTYLIVVLCYYGAKVGIEHGDESPQVTADKLRTLLQDKIVEDLVVGFTEKMKDR